MCWARKPSRYGCSRLSASSSADDLAVATQRQVRSGPILERQQLELLESSPLRQQHPRVVIKGGERRAPPQLQRGTEHAGCGAGIVSQLRSATLEERLELE